MSASAVMIKILLRQEFLFDLDFEVKNFTLSVFDSPVAYSSFSSRFNFPDPQDVWFNLNIRAYKENYPRGFPRLELEIDILDKPKDIDVLNLYRIINNSNSDGYGGAISLNEETGVLTVNSCFRLSGLFEDVDSLDPEEIHLVSELMMNWMCGCFILAKDTHHRTTQI